MVPIPWPFYWDRVAGGGNTLRRSLETARVPHGRGVGYTGLSCHGQEQLPGTHEESQFHGLLPHGTGLWKEGTLYVGAWRSPKHFTFTFTMRRSGVNSVAQRYKVMQSQASVLRLGALPATSARANAICPESQGPFWRVPTAVLRGKNEGNRVDKRPSPAPNDSRVNKTDRIAFVTCR